MTGCFWGLGSSKKIINSFRFVIRTQLLQPINRKICLLASEKFPFVRRFSRIRAIISLNSLQVK